LRWVGALLQCPVDRFVLCFQLIGQRKAFEGTKRPDSSCQRLCRPRICETGADQRHDLAWSGMQVPQVNVGDPAEGIGRLVVAAVSIQRLSLLDHYRGPRTPLGRVCRVLGHGRRDTGDETAQ
jgi:hypothetical protein